MAYHILVFITSEIDLKFEVGLNFFALTGNNQLPQCFLLNILSFSKSTAMSFCLFYWQQKKEVESGRSSINALPCVSLPSSIISLFISFQSLGILADIFVLVPTSYSKLWFPLSFLTKFFHLPASRSLLKLLKIVSPVLFTCCYCEFITLIKF